MDLIAFTQVVNTFGLAGVAAWFMWREPRITGAIDRNTTALNSLLVFLGGRPPSGGAGDAAR